MSSKSSLYTGITAIIGRSS